jgi:hypothetical protein
VRSKMNTIGRLPELRLMPHAKEAVLYDLPTNTVSPEGRDTGGGSPATTRQSMWTDACEVWPQSSASTLSLCPSLSGRRIELRNSQPSTAQQHPSQESRLGGEVR